MSDPNRFNGYLLLNLLIVVGNLIWFQSSYHGPAVVPASASPAEFSAERAIDAFRQILGPEEPHVAGTLENAAVRDRLVAHLRELGCEVELAPFETSGLQMTNVMAVVRGDSSRRPLMLATHYDSVEEGPGVGDAGSCVAALVETARIIKEQADSQPLSRDVWFVFTDGEEWVRGVGHGLNGALHFAGSDHPLRARNPLVLNFDARGASGPSLLYETGGQNYQLMSTLLPALPRPAFTGSSFVSVYERLPNATDFTIFKRPEAQSGANLQGVNFAFIGDPQCYHTPEDNFASLDERSVQHHGENAVALTNVLLDAPSDNFESDQSAVFFSVGRWIVCYPETWALPMSIGLLVVQLLGCLLTWKRGKATWSEFSVGGAAILMVMVAGGVVGAGFARVNPIFDPANGNFSLYDGWILLTLWAVVLGLGWFLCSSVRWLTNAASMWNAIWLSWAVLGVLAAYRMPGVSYLVFFPCLIPAVLSLTTIDRNRLALAATLAACLTSVPLGYQISLGLGVQMGVALGPIAAFLFSPLFVHFVADTSKPDAPAASSENA